MLERDITKVIMSELRPQKVILLYGARRVGKTTLTQQIAAQYQGRVSILNAEDMSTMALLSERTASNYKQLFADTDLLIVDEAQHIPDIGWILKLLTDELTHLSIIASGSSSFDLQNKAGEPLVGRCYEFMLYPFSVNELLKQTTVIQFLQTIEWQLIYGAYPELLTLNEAQRYQRYLNEIVSAYLLRDILTIDGIKHSAKMMQLLQLLAYQVGSEVSYDAIANRLSLSRNSVEKYIDLLTKAFIIYRLPAFSRNPRKEVSKPGKVYFFDNGIRNAVIGDFRPLSVRQDVGALWENYLITERIKRQNNNSIFSKHYFWRTYNGQEIDLIEETNGQIEAFEFKWGNHKPKVPSAFNDMYPDASYQVINKENMLAFCR